VGIEVAKGYTAAIFIPEDGDSTLLEYGGAHAAYYNKVFITHRTT
jgi:hypothetical protein